MHVPTPHSPTRKTGLEVGCRVRRPGSPHRAPRSRPRRPWDSALAFRITAARVRPTAFWAVLLPPAPLPLVLVLTALAFAAQIVQAEAPEQALRAAQDSFLFGEYDAAAAGALHLIEKGGLPPALLREAHVLAAQCYLELGAEDAVDAAICAAHTVDPLWQPSSTVFTEREVIRFAAALRACPEAPTRSAPVLERPTDGTSSPSPNLTPGSQSPGSRAALASPDSTSQVAGVPPQAGRPWFRRPLSWIVGGAAAVGIAVLSLGSGDGGSPNGPEDSGNTDGMGDFPAAPED